VALGGERSLAGTAVRRKNSQKMPEMDGIELLAPLRQGALTAPMVVVTGYGDVTPPVKARRPEPWTP